MRVHGIHSTVLVTGIASPRPQTTCFELVDAQRHRERERERKEESWKVTLPEECVTIPFGCSLSAVAHAQWVGGHGGFAVRLAA